MSRALVLVTVLSAASGCKKADEHTAPVGENALQAATVVTEAPSEDGEWRMPAKNHASTRYSDLSEIDTRNVARLKLAWSWTTEKDRGHEAAPIVVGGMMYVTMPFPNELVAFDLTAPGKPKWIYAPEPAPAAQGVACCDVVNRGATYSDGRLFFNTLDNHTIAVDAETGTPIWKTKLGDVTKGETMTMAPLVVKDLVLVGNSGADLGVRGWLTALSASTGDIVWRAYSTGPDSDCLIGDEFQPFYPQERGKDLGVRTWPPGKWEIGGGAVWGWLSYDPELDLVYYGTANPGPWNNEQRPGDNKWTAGIFARRPSDGAAIWFYPWSSHDVFDHDGVNENVLVDLEIDGARRRVLVHPDRNGYVYVLDRETGEVLSAEPFVHITTTLGVDRQSGRLRHLEGKIPGVGHIVHDICPASPGAKDWQPSAFSPRTKLLYIPHQNLCQDEETYEANYIAGTPYLGSNVRMKPGPGGNRGVFTGWDVARSRVAWKIEERFPVWSGALATGGDVVFYGTMDGLFKAVDARTGELLWSYRAPSGIIGQPVTYRGPDGQQYVAVLAGVGGWAGAIVAGGLDPSDPTGALGFVGAMTDLPQYTRPGGALLVFALGDEP